MLDIYAGASALNKIKAHGLSPALFDTILGASGGPKWFVLAGLDRILIPEFFASTSHELNVVGSSAGAFRSACMAQSDPRAAIDRLAHYYSHTVYDGKPTPKDITQSVIDIMDSMMGENGIDEIINNPRVKAHFIVARAKGFNRYESKYLQIPGLALSAGLNYGSRRFLKRSFDRVVFSTSPLEILCPYALPSDYQTLTKANLIQALTASGSIPAIMEGVKDIVGAPKGMYRDGGVVDYHFDMQFKHHQNNDKLILYPHFYAKPSPGWFDKSIKSRTPHINSYDNVVMLVPSRQFVNSLPYRKIPDRTDFETMDASTRIAYWTEVLKQTDKLGDTFLEMASDPNISQRIKPFGFS